MGRPMLRWLPAFVIAATVLYTFSTYPALPAQIPAHWGINGQPTSWTPREFGAWLLPAMMVFVWLPSLLVPKPAVSIVVTAILTFQAVIQYAMLSIAQGHAVDINTVVYVGMGALFAICGAAIPKGLGLLLVGAGVLTICTALTASPHQVFVVFLSSSMLASLGTVLLSLWRKR